MKKLNITFCSTPDFASNAKALYEYMLKRYGTNMNFTWIVKSKKMYEHLQQKNVSSLLLGTEDYFKYVKTTDVFFTTHANITNDKPKDSLYVELWHGISSKPVGHLVNNLKLDDEKWFNHLKRKLDYIIVPSSFWIPIFSSRFNIKPNRILDIGYPKLNYIVNSNGKKSLEKIINTDISVYKKIIYYSPTYLKGCGWELSKNCINNLINLRSYNENILEQYLIKNNYLLCINHHPEDEIHYKPYESNNIKLIKSEDFEKNDITIDQVLNAADLLITDYSSLGIEFLFLEKNVLYINTDIEEYTNTRGFMYNDFEFWSPGYKVNTIEEMLKKINLIFSSPNERIDEIKRKKKLFFGNLEDGNCQSICNYFFKDNYISSNVQYYLDTEEVLEEKIKKTEFKIKKAEFKIKGLELKSLELLNKNQQTEKELYDIINSKGWKFLNKLRKIKKMFIRSK